MKFFMKNADSKTLILIDEFGTGTEPTVGGAIAEAVLSDILKKKSFGLITTHYTNLKFFASSNDGIVNGAMLFDTQNIQPLFRLQTGVPGSSFAFEIARKIGLPETVLKEAEAKLGDTQVKMEKSLREIARDKKYWEAKRDRIRKTGQKIDELSETYENELIEIRDIRKKLISEAKEEAQKILATVNREVEKTIRTIKESQADKEKTRIARDKLDKLKQNIAENNFVDSRIEREMRKVKNRISRKAQRQKNNEKTPVQQTPVVTRQEKSLPEIGDRVKIKGQQVAGEIVSSGKGNIAVAFGNIIMNVTPDSVEKVSQFDDRETASRPRSSLASDMLNKKLNFKSLLDVRGERTVDAIEKVTAFVDEAIMLGMSEVKILHGKGNGILREEIRRYLKTFGDILKLSDEQEESGGAGITVVKIN
jgi:DNA mismatch repair protein MutS2